MQQFLLTARKSEADGAVPEEIRQEVSNLQAQRTV